MKKILIKLELMNIKLDKQENLEKKSEKKLKKKKL